MRVIELVRSERKATPLVVSSDNGGGFGSEELDRHLERERIVHLRNLPRTPEHNAWVEEAHGELKEEGDLGKGVELSSLEGAARIVLDRVVRLNGVRLRATHGYRTADAVDAETRPWYGRVRRERFYADACAAQKKAVVGLERARARRMAEREAIFRTMEECGLLSRTRSASPRAASNPKGFPTHHTINQKIGMTWRRPFGGFPQEWIILTLVHEMRHAYLDKYCNNKGEPHHSQRFYDNIAAAIKLILSNPELVKALGLDPAACKAVIVDAERRTPQDGE